MKTILMVGTRKGMWIGTSDEARTFVGLERPTLPDGGGLLRPDRHAVARPRGSSAAPRRAGSARRSGAPTTSAKAGRRRRTARSASPRTPKPPLARIWQLTPGVGRRGSSGRARSPARSSSSTDRGQTFELVRGLWDHPQRPEWGAGYGGQAFHTILPHPTDPLLRSWRRSPPAGSTGPPTGERPGSRRTRASRPSSTRVTATTPSSASACTRWRGTRSNPDRLFLQNHGGVYRSDDGGSSLGGHRPRACRASSVSPRWSLTPHQPDTAYVFPIADAGGRWPVDGKARVYRTQDAGGTWEPLGEGSLPDEFWVAVMRDAMCTDDHATAGLYFGGRNGVGVGARRTRARPGSEIHSDLPDVMVVRAASL